MAHKKTGLPHKTCAQCQCPFAWRRKWWRCWEEVKYCSERCRREAKVQARANHCAAASVEDEF